MKPGKARTMKRDKYRVDVDDQGTILKTLNDQAHCATGPAVEYLTGWKDWFIIGMWVRNKDPESNDKYKVDVEDGGGIYRELNGVPHCTTGPAIGGGSHRDEWWVGGTHYHEELFKECWPDDKK